MHAILGICTRCGYDLTGQTMRCPECGSAVDQVAIKPDSRAARSLTNRWRWLYAPTVIYLFGVLAWHWLIHPATGHGLTTLPDNLLSVAIIFTIPYALHAFAALLLRRGGGLRDIRSRIWFLTLPALHAWWIAWPLVMIATLRISHAIGIDDRSAARAIFGLWPLGVAVLMPLITWRTGWWIVNRRLRITVRPGAGAWIAAGLIGVPSGLMLVFMVLALATIDV